MLGDGSKVKGSLRRLMLNVNKAKFLRFQIWKNWFVRCKEREFVKKIKGLQVKQLLIGIADRVTKSSLDRILGNGTRAVGAIRRILTCIKIKYFKSFIEWKENVMILKKRDLQIANKASKRAETIAKRTARSLFDSILGDCRIRRLLNKLVKNYQEMQKNAYTKLWNRVEKIRTIKKINSASFVFKSLVISAKKTVAFRFKYWKNLEYLRRRRIMKKAAGKMIQTMSISYESGFWKWKYILS
jgi:hypothetical protein